MMNFRRPPPKLSRMMQRAPAPSPPDGPAPLRLRHYPPDVGGVYAGLAAVLAGSYDVPGLTFDAPPRILDLGAHVGSFSVWALSRWPGAAIVAYEPAPDSAETLRRNVAGLPVVVREFAVVGEGAPPTATLYEGRDNTGQRSLHQLGEQRGTGVPVTTVRARDLPPCDVLKLDCEGEELPILRDYPHLAGVRCLMLEWHSLTDYETLLTWTPSLGFRLVADTAKGRWVADRNLLFVRDEEVRHPLDGAGLDERASHFLFIVPRSSLAMLTELAPSYDLHALPGLVAPTVLDVGAHVGGFAWYALTRWPGAAVRCYEPHPETFALLRGNLAGLLASVEQAAVVFPHVPGGTVRLYEGVHGRHECSVRDDVRWPHCSQDLARFVEVPTVDAASLPRCDVLKVDCEGNEEAVLSGYPHLDGVRVLLVEAHPVGGDLARMQRSVRRFATRAGLTEIGGHVMRFVRR